MRSVIATQLAMSSTLRGRKISVLDELRCLTAVQLVFTLTPSKNTILLVFKLVLFVPSPNDLFRRTRSICLGDRVLLPRRTCLRIAIDLVKLNEDRETRSSLLIGIRGRRTIPCYRNRSVVRLVDLGSDRLFKQVQFIPEKSHSYGQGSLVVRSSPQSSPWYTPDLARRWLEYRRGLS